MNETVVLPQFGCSVVLAGEALALGPALLASQKAQQEISKSAESILRATFSALENQVTAAIEKRTAAEFEVVRGQVFQSYHDAVLALPALMKLVMSENGLEMLVRESLCVAESELRDAEAGQILGASVRDQAMFTLWTLRKITELVNQIPTEAASVSPDDQHLRDLFGKFRFYGVWTRFHLQCVYVALRGRKPLHAGVLEPILMGLRAEVNAYAYVRQMVDVLAPRTFADDPIQEWDDEDASLLESATYDLMSEEV